jgi:hypothetical protein
LVKHALPGVGSGLFQPSAVGILVLNSEVARASTNFGPKTVSDCPYGAAS